LGTRSSSKSADVTFGCLLSTDERLEQWTSTDENVVDLLENGLYGLMTPRRFGGSELGSETMIDVTIERPRLLLERC
jgi:hypothetical protein